MYTNLDRQLNNARNQARPLRMGVIGVGNMGQHHVRILSLLKEIE
ncbi:MAG: hypothetical protein RLZZ69_2411, partial [Cyanobacteriota bacterium]